MLLIGIVLLVLYALQGGLHAPIQGVLQDPTSGDAWLRFIGFVVAIGVGITVHEFMHAYAAHRLGDDTGRLMGRLTLNPAAHFDFFGSLLLVLVGFGYGKPVPFNESRLRGASAVSVVAIAGPLANFVIAALCAIPLRFSVADTLGGAYQEILMYVVIYNCILGIFNLVPIPPLDGSNVIYGLLPPRQQYSWRSFSQYGPLLLLALLFFGGRLLSQLVFGPAQSLANFLVGARLF
ncbi:MAG TPA: site-2 protease family protein [Candidatus Limnocylindria bacterium]|nr:site-2 protease family protein [Candidatus Limnocylindria bacterium]